DDASGAVPEDEDGQAGVFGPRLPDEPVHVAQVVRELLDKETLPFGLAAPPEIEGIAREPLARELLGGPGHVDAVRVESVDEDQDGARLPGRLPRACGDLHPTDAFEGRLIHGSPPCLVVSA